MQQIAIFSHKAKKHFAIFKEKQIKQNRKIYTLTLFIILCYSIYYQLI